GTSHPISAVQNDGQKISLNLYQPQPHQAEAAFDVVVNQLGTSLYGQLHQTQRRQFLEIFEAPRGISQADYFNLTKVMLSDPKRRNLAVQRIGFVYQFRQYLAGNLSDRQAEFFDKIKSKYSQNSGDL
ncbi:MAG: hypothetical protein LBU20_00535, partial [Candidatus Nomurabacteria bacterium]|nr:hypothetical protein [Candidatus Nomurabacteria bacterium]